MLGLIYQNTLMTETDELWVNFKEWVKSACLLWWRQCRCRWIVKSWEQRQHWYKHFSVCVQMCCVSWSLEPYFMCICFSRLPLRWQTQHCQLYVTCASVCVCLQVALLTDSSRRLTSFPQVDYTLLMGSVSQLHDNFLFRLLCRSIPKPLRSTC